MTMTPKITAQVLDFDTNALPEIPTRVNTTLRFTVWESGLNRFYDKAKLVGYHAKQVNDSLFIDGRMAETPKVKRRAVGDTLSLTPLGRRTQTLHLCCSRRVRNFVP
jgi:hypothetical protein